MEAHGIIASHSVSVSLSGPSTLVLQLHRLSLPNSSVQQKLSTQLNAPFVLTVYPKNYSGSVSDRNTDANSEINTASHCHVWLSFSTTVDMQHPFDPMSLRCNANEGKQASDISETCALLGWGTELVLSASVPVLCVCAHAYERVCACVHVSVCR